MVLLWFVMGFPSLANTVVVSYGESYPTVALPVSRSSADPKVFPTMRHPWGGAFVNASDKKAYLKQ